VTAKLNFISLVRSMISQQNNYIEKLHNAQSLQSFLNIPFPQDSPAKASLFFVSYPFFESATEEFKRYFFKRFPFNNLDLTNSYQEDHFFRRS